MPNYRVSGAKFDPFTMDELLRPAIMATQAHQDIENQLGDLSQKADIWQNLANEQADPETYKMYQTYANDLRAKVDDLAANGLNPRSRQGLLDMKRRYSSEITPIENAYNTRKEQIAAQQDLRAKGYLISRNAATTSLDDYLKDPALSFQSYSGDALTKSVSAAARNLQKELAERPEYWKSILGGQYYERILRNGFTSEEVLKAINGDEDADPRLTQLVTTALDQSGIKDWNNPEELARAVEYANQGLWDAVGASQVDRIQNRGYMSYGEKALMDARIEQAQAAADAAKEKARRAELGIPNNAIPVGDGSYMVKSGNTWITIGPDGVQKDEDGNPITSTLGSDDIFDKYGVDENTLQERILQSSGVADMRNIGYSPVGVVVRHDKRSIWGDSNGVIWQSGKQGEDMKHVDPVPFKTNTRTNLVQGGKLGRWFSNRDTFTYEPRGGDIDFVGSRHTDENPDTIAQIPGYAVNSSGRLTPENNTPMDEIVNVLKAAGVIDIEGALNSIDVQIMRVSARGSRDDYDYEVFIRDDSPYVVKKSKK